MKLHLFSNLNQHPRLPSPQKAPLQPLCPQKDIISAHCLDGIDILPPSLGIDYEVIDVSCYFIKTEGEIGLHGDLSKPSLY